ncbi:Hypothetical predicted protein [Mytilus galloprovincialis]|uniref:Uncharacterized protein n=1 Tax=Mytilus galloprovincialis TaxID=29158 RepID=A0A8B6EHS0_MYTGA|nr:Hypothetical predicted protein [Mytilus galloprovincialis]
MAFVTQVTENRETSIVLKVRELITLLTGSPPRNAGHIEELKYMLENFAHPNVDGVVYLQDYEDRSGTCPMNSDFWGKLADWRHLSQAQQTETKEFLLMKFSIDDLKLALDQYITENVVKDLPFESNDQGTFIELGKFTKYLRDHEDHSDTSGIRKGNILRQVSKYKDGIRRKDDFFNLCKTLKDGSQQVQRMVEKTVEINRSRKVSTEALNGIQLEVEGHKHLPDHLERDIMTCIKPYISENIASVLCVDCSNTCNHFHGIHVLVDLAQDLEIPCLDNICVIIRALLQRIHFLNAPEIVFLTNYTFRSFKDSIPPRFTVRDQLKMGVLSDNIYHVSKTHNDEAIEPDELIQPNLCSSCFKEYTYLTDPLDINHFNVSREWLLHVPLPVQIQLEHTYISKDVKNAVSIEQVKPKISALYCQFEAHLKTLNQSYGGIIQDIYTDELLVNYHNISTVFSLTSHAGISHSQRTGDRRLRKNADPEICYYRTFMKKYQLTYRGIDQDAECLQEVSMKQCHLALLMDNLVHLTMNVDPHPGQSRTNQLCTLPLTVKGIPKNAHLTSCWHTNSCDQDRFCSCMHETELGKDDVNKTFLEQTPDEQDTNNIFTENMTWGFQSLFGVECIKSLIEIQKLAQSTIQSQKRDNYHSNNSQTEMEISMEEVNKTMESMNISLNHLDPDETIPLETDIMTVETDIGTASEPEPFNDISFSGSMQSRLDDLDESTGMHSFWDEQLSLDLSEIQSNISTLSLENAEFELLNDEEEGNIEELIYTMMSTDNDSITLPVNDQSRTECQPVLPVAAPPPLLCRHPPPASGRDDDILVLKKVLDDILIKTDVNVKEDKIIFAPDYKIAKNLLKLIDSTEKYKVFIPEFPILHLRKSKITNLISAYKTTGLLHILRYMKDEENEKDWTKLLTIENIETATRNIWRLSVALHLSFFVCYVSTLTEEEAGKVIEVLEETPEQLKNIFGDNFESFLKKGENQNATFCLHLELMRHCDEIVAIAVSERIGGENGYSLLLANVKSSLPFSFLNNASSYAGFCIRLLLSHSSCSPFHQKLKHSLYTSPHNDSKVNFGLDTSREIDHRTAKKCIRPTSTINSVLPKMSTVDDQRQIHIMRMSLLTGLEEVDDTSAQDNKSAKSCASKFIQKQLSSNDMEHIMRTAKLIIKMNALSHAEQKIPKNIYHPSKPEISETLLDKTTYAPWQLFDQKVPLHQWYIRIE